MCIYYTAYITTNLINNKEYIGVHQTTDLNDTYLGSGTILKQAIKKYGRAAFNKKVIALFENADYMFQWEAENVTQEIVDDPMYYNCKTGGFGGCNYSDESRSKMSASAKGRIPWNKGKAYSDETKAKISAAGRARAPISEATRIKLQNRKQSPESNLKRSMTQKGKILSDTTKNKIRLARLGTERSLETKVKISNNQKGKIRGPYKIKHSDTQT